MKPEAAKGAKSSEAAYSNRSPNFKGSCLTLLKHCIWFFTAMQLGASDLPSATWTHISTMRRCPTNWCANLCKKTQHHKTYITNDWFPFTLLLTSWCFTVFFSVYTLCMHCILGIHLIHFIHTMLLRTSFALITHTLWRAPLFFCNSLSPVFWISNQAKESRFLFSLRS